MRFVYLVLGIVFNINTHKNTRERENSIKEIAYLSKNKTKIQTIQISKLRWKSLFIIN